jgi:protein-L-isoaspartate(D-aspartate) O-methyltransferase
MVDVLRDTGRLRTPAVEEAFRAVPRHLFLPGLGPAEAYADEAVAVQSTAGVTTSSASQPSMVAIMLEQLDLRPGQRVLEIGAGTGFNAALLARIVGPHGAVTTVDIDEDLVARAAVHLAAAGVTGVELVTGDGALGHPPRAPYDRIVLTVGSDDVRPEWVTQLAPGGRLLLPLAVRGSQLSVALDLGPDGLLHSASVRSCAFIRLRGAAAGRDTTPRDVEGWGLALQLPEDGPGADGTRVAAALDEPGSRIPVPVSLGPADVWDGCGLWLALSEPKTCRVLVTDPDAGLADDLLPLGAVTGTVGLVSGADADPVGIALVVARPGPGDPGQRAPVDVRPFGPAGAALAAELLDALERWDADGRPGAPDWRFTVVPAGAAEPIDGRRVVRKEHCCVVAELIRPTCPT